MHFDQNIEAAELWKARKAFVSLAGGWPKISKSYEHWDGKDRHDNFWTFYEIAGRRFGARSIYSNQSMETLFVEDLHSIEHLIPRSFLYEQLRGRGSSEELIASAVTNPFNLVPSNRKVNRRRGSSEFDLDNDPVVVHNPQRFSHVHWVYGKDWEGEWVIPPRSRGDVARAVIYMCLLYQLEGEYADDMDAFLAWHREDPVSPVEIAYNAWVKEKWGICNPLIG